MRPPSGMNCHSPTAPGVRAIERVVAALDHRDVDERRRGSVRAAQRVLEDRAVAALLCAASEVMIARPRAVVPVELEVADDARVEAHRQIGQLEPSSHGGGGVSIGLTNSCGARIGGLLRVATTRRAEIRRTDEPRRSRSRALRRSTSSRGWRGAGRALSAQRPRAKRAGIVARQKKHEQPARHGPTIRLLVGGHNFSRACYWSNQWANRSSARAPALSAAPTTPAGSTARRARGQQGVRALYARRHAPRLLEGGAWRHHRQPARRGGRRGGGAAPEASAPPSS